MQTNLPFQSSEECRRCGSSDVDADRSQFTLLDDARSTGALSTGNLCDVCFQQVMKFATGER